LRSEFSWNFFRINEFFEETGVSRESGQEDYKTGCYETVFAVSMRREIKQGAMRKG
jgi:hypothetical protein